MERGREREKEQEKLWELVWEREEEGKDVIIVHADGVMGGGI